MIARWPCSVRLPYPVLTLVMAVVVAIAGLRGLDDVSAQTGECHPAYGDCLPVVDDLNCNDIGDKQVEVLNVDDDPYGLDDANGPGNGITCDGDDRDDAPAVSTMPAGGSEPTGSAGITAASTLGGSSGWAEAEADYLNTIRLMLRAVAESIGRTEKLINVPLPVDEHWKANLGAEITIWQVMEAQALEMTPPAAFSELHPLVLEYFRLCSDAGDAVATWAVTSDAASLEQSKAALSQAGTVIDEAWTVLEGIREARGIPAE
jgi:hypothetical protein